MSVFEEYKDALTDKHCILDQPFLGSSRRYEVHILSKCNFDFNFVNADLANWEPVDFLTIERPDLVVAMQGYKFKGKTEQAGLEIFQLDDPFSNIKREDRL